MNSNTYRYVEKRDADGNLIEFSKVKATCSLEQITSLQEEHSKYLSQEKNRILEEQNALTKEKEKKEFLEIYSYKNIAIIALPLILNGKFKDLNFLIELAKIEDKDVLANKIIYNLELPEFALIKELFKKQFLNK